MSTTGKKETARPEKRTNERLEEKNKADNKDAKLHPTI